jgi:hypothetical protein
LISSTKEKTLKTEKNEAKNFFASNNNTKTIFEKKNQRMGENLCKYHVRD